MISSRFLVAMFFSTIRNRNTMVSFIALASIIGIAISVSSMIMVLSVMNGFQYELKNRVLSIIPHGEFEGIQKPVSNWQLLMKQIKQCNTSIDSVAPYIRLMALVNKGLYTKAIEVRGIIPSLEENFSSFSDFIDSQVWQTFHSDSQQIILGKGVADSIHAKKGDYVTLMVTTTGSNELNKLPAPKKIRLKIAGLLELHGQLDHNLALIPLKDAQKYTQLGDSVTGIAVKVNDVLNAEKIISEVNINLSNYLYSSSWQKKFGFLYRDIQLIRTIVYLIMVLVMCLASFNIVSALMMTVKGCSKDIAILRSIGADDVFIKKIFVYKGIILSLSGSSIGGIIGVIISMNLTSIIKKIELLVHHNFLSRNIYFINFLPSKVNFFDVALIFFITIVLSLLATWLPAIKASKLKPASILNSK
ncbi:lipoprotein-releasing ABC transporter permease subunit LolE [Candidatus Photodesmus katoptron]|uniref:lipoprotein-releasing ABC transporter permease subunit LolE n=1 Tax=Candidatus Photodesmus anomalopis TaxID=28176 RepID=UPI00240EB4A1|nr:lipoprotein-releasing ABC transporter permease subunit LolE [Candidatus Photodesmus katoptron]